MLSAEERVKEVRDLENIKTLLTSISPDSIHNLDTVILTHCDPKSESDAYHHGVVIWWHEAVIANVPSTREILFEV